MDLRCTGGFTWLEVLIAMIVLFVLISLALPLIEFGPSKRDRMTQMLSKAKQLHLATTQMALDGLTTGDTNLGWPGDTGGTFSHWAQTLAKEGYLSTNDLGRLLMRPGQTAPSNQIPSRDECAFLVYAVSEKSSSDTVFLSTRNFTNPPVGGSQSGKAFPHYDTESFIVFHKGGMAGTFPAPHPNPTPFKGTFAPLCQ